jgi:hypothetical protein
MDVSSLRPQPNSSPNGNKNTAKLSLAPRDATTNTKHKNKTANAIQEIRARLAEGEVINFFFEKGMFDRPPTINRSALFVNAPLQNTEGV